MTAISIAIGRGQSGLLPTNYTIGSAAPGTLDIEFRFNLADANSVNLTRKDLVTALRQLEYLIGVDSQVAPGTPIIALGV